MLSRSKVEDHCTSFMDADDTDPEVRRFIKDFLILIEFGQFEPDDEETDYSEQ